jgi:hypothetical protein
MLDRSGSLVGIPRDAMIVKPGSGRDAEAVAATMSSAVADLATQIAASLGSGRYGLCAIRMTIS